MVYDRGAVVDSIRFIGLAGANDVVAARGERVDESTCIVRGLGERLASDGVSNISEVIGADVR